MRKTKTMKRGEILHGFSVVSSEFVPEVDGTLWLLRHGKLNTPLAFLEREDRNKSFYIAFKTPPADSTGVFHIIEHSVLCGSRKFPVKEPFVELLKSSLNTFLNAMTYQDRTVYPVASRSDKDFLNLIDVYMDAVFHPLMLENESIFMQEGHRFELGEGGELSVNGVVYNEMKGAMSSPDELSGEALLTLLYPNSPFGRNSGGEPDEILGLDYEDFCAAHKKHYHPSNALIFLDGKVNLDEVLPLLDSYLSEYEPRDEKISVGKAPKIEKKELTLKYEISPEESEEGKLRAYLGVRTFDFDKIEEGFMLSVVADAIAGSNEAPLVKPFLDEGLCEDVTLFPIGSGFKYGSYGIELKNLTCSAEKAYERLYSVIKKIADEGIGEGRLSASFNSIEFKLREKDFGSIPKGLVFGLAMLDTWVYGGESALGLKYEELLAAVRKKLDTGAPEELLRKIFLTNEDTVRLVLEPDKSLAKERAEREREMLKKMKDSLSGKALDELLCKTKSFELWQGTPEGEDALEKIPKLTVGDIPKTADIAPTSAETVSGVRVLSHNIPTGGITYAELIFDISDLGPKELALTALLSSLLGKCKTANHSADELSQLRKSKLGSFSASPTLFLGEKTALPALHITASALDSERESLINITKEILNTTDFSEKSTVKNILTQKLTAKKESFASSGHAAAVRRARSYVSAAGVLAEELLGYEMYKNLKKTEEELLFDFDSFAKGLSALLKKITTKARLTCAYTGAPSSEFEKALAEIPKEPGTPPTALKREPYGPKNEGFVIPSRVSYIGRAAALSDVGERFVGSMHVLSNILSYTYLWNAVRVKGGAYGAGFSARRAGDVSVYSYRDPSPESSLYAMDGAADFLRTLADEESSLDSYIIGTFGSYDPLHTPRSAGEEATELYITGRTPEGEAATRKKMLEFNKKELLRLADVTEALSGVSASCVFGPREKIDACMGILKTKVEI